MKIRTLLLVESPMQRQSFSNTLSVLKYGMVVLLAASLYHGDWPEAAACAAETLALFILSLIILRGL